MVLIQTKSVDVHLMSVMRKAHAVSKKKHYVLKAHQLTQNVV